MEEPPTLGISVQTATGQQPQTSEVVDHPDTGTAIPTLTALRIHSAPDMPIAPGTPARPWMEATRDRFAYRCLPLLIANESGWVIQSSHTILATWDGGQANESLRIEYLNGDPTRPASSHFGHGILTWTLPYLFRTSHGYNLLMRGPANWPKDGAHALEGTVETDWLPATATMNWKLTRPGLTVRFDIGEPICMLVPQRRGELESFRTSQEAIAEHPDERSGFQQWADSRSRFSRDLRERVDLSPNESWQKDYFHGTSPGGRSSSEHQRRLKLDAFDRVEDGTGPGGDP